jgi:hypothetical protein
MEPPDDLLAVLARRHLHAAGAPQVVDWAVAALVRGLDSESLRVLAGSTPLLNEFEVDDLLQQTARELGFPIPNRADCLAHHARQIAREIVAGRRTPAEGCLALVRVSAALDDPADLRGFVSLDDDLEMSREGGSLVRSNVEAAIIRKARSLIGD